MFLNYIHNFRGLAILLIVAQHCMDSFQWNQQEMTYHLLAFIIRDATSLFMFISGFLFQYLSYKFDYKSYMKNKLRYIILPYLIVSAPAIIILMFIRQRYAPGSDFYSHPVIVQIMLFYLTGSHITAFWFIPMITVYYILSPLFIRLDKFRLTYYLIPLFFLVSIWTPTSENILNACISYFPDYMLGMCCSRYREKILEMNSKFLILLILIYFFIMGVYICGFRFRMINVHIISYLSKTVLNFFLITILYRYENKIRLKWDYLAGISLGIYFLHSYIIQILRFFIAGSMGGFLPVKGHIVISLLLFFIIVVALTSLMIDGIKKISGKYSRYLIGC